MHTNRNAKTKGEEERRSSRTTRTPTTIHDRHEQVGRVPEDSAKDLLARSRRAQSDQGHKRSRKEQTRKCSDYVPWFVLGVPREIGSVRHSSGLTPDGRVDASHD